MAVGVSDGVLPPHDEHAERFALGYALTFDAVPFASLEPRHFFADAHGHIFAAIRAGADGAEAVFRHLAATPRSADLYRRGGSPYLAELMIGVPSETPDALAMHASACADSIREHWRRRVLCEAISRVQEDLRSGECSSQEAWVRLKEASNAAAAM